VIDPFPKEVLETPYEGDTQKIEICFPVPVVIPERWDQHERRARARALLHQWAGRAQAYARYFRNAR
jgi:hypothetical protein